MVFSDNTHECFHDSGFPQFSKGIFLLRNVTQCCAINYAMLCNLFSRAVLTKQFSAIKSEFFPISTFTSAESFKARGCLTK